MKKFLVYGLTSNTGGLEIFIAKTILNMDLSDIELHVLLYEKPIFYNELKEKGVIFDIVTRRGKNPFSNYREVENLFKKNKFDVVWLNACTLTYIAPLIMAKKYGVPVRAIHSHNTEVTRGFPMGLFHKFNKTRISNYANMYLGCTSEAAEFLAPKDIVKNKDYIVIKNAIDLEKYEFSEENRDRVRKEFNIDKDSFVIGNVGHLIDIKNQTFLIDVFLEITKQIKNTNLILVGTGILEQSLKEKIKRLELEDKVIFAGRRSDVNLLLSAFDAFVMPSKFEGLPLVAVESQASGLKTFLSTNISKEAALTDLVEYIDLTADLKDWADIIIKSSKSYERKSKFDILSEKGFSIKENADKIKKLLLNV